MLVYIIFIRQSMIILQRQTSVFFCLKHTVGWHIYWSIVNTEFDIDDNDDLVMITIILVVVVRMIMAGDDDYYTGGGGTYDNDC